MCNEKARTRIAAPLLLKRPVRCQSSRLPTLAMAASSETKDFEVFVGRLRGGPNNGVMFIPHFVLGLDVTEADSWPEEARLDYISSNLAHLLRIFDTAETRR